MEKKFIYQIIRPITTNEGFSLIETLLSLLLIATLSILSISKMGHIDVSYAYLINDLLIGQSDALVNRERVDVDTPYSKYRISYNESGRVNRAQSIDIGDKKVVIHLGNGYITYE